MELFVILDPLLILFQHCTIDGNRVQVPSWFLNVEEVHQHLTLCDKTGKVSAGCYNLQTLNFLNTLLLLRQTSALPFTRHFSVYVARLKFACQS